MLVTLLLQAAGENYSQVFLLLGMGIIFYFFMIRPQQRRSAETKKFRSSLAKGARVVTIGGLHGLVVDVTDETVVVEVDRGTKLRFDRSAIAREITSKTADSPAS